MRDPSRIEEYCERFKMIWEKYPDLRFTQVILNLVKDPGWYYVEDETFFSELEKFYE